MRTFHWVKSVAGFWLPFETADLSCANVSGVYVIWYDADPPATVCVGHGPIAARLSERRQDRGILMYRKFGELCVTWAEVPSPLQQAVARYLSERLEPAFGDTLMLVPPVAVPLPDFKQQLEHAV